MTAAVTPLTPVELAARRWKNADQEFVRHQRVCRRWQVGRPCRECDRLEVATNLTSRAYARALEQQTAP
jgi:hypothetical protein